MKVTHGAVGLTQVRHLRHAAARVKAIDPTRLTIQSVLTTPDEDLQGDIVFPAGGVWKSQPYVNFDHDPHTILGTGSVDLVGSPDGLLPVGTTHFAKSNRNAEQVFQLAEAGVLTGVSLEFVPVQFKSRGFMAPNTNPAREACEYSQWQGMGWAHCPMPVNPNARILEKALRILDTGKIGRTVLTDPVLAVIRKSFGKHRPARKSSVTVPRTVGKAMQDEYDDEVPLPDDTGGDPMMTDPAAMPEEPPAPMEDMAPMAEGESDLPPEATDAYDGAQSLADMATRFRERAGKTLHPKSRKMYARWAEELESMAAEYSDHAEGVESELEGAAPETETESPAEEASEPQPETEPDDADDVGEDKDKESEEKSLRPIRRKPDGTLITKSGYVPKRYRMAGGQLETVKPTASAALKSAINDMEAKLDAMERANAQARRRNRMAYR